MLKVAWNSLYAHPLPVKHRFPMEKYDLIPEQLLHEGTISETNLFDPGLPSEADILRVHDKNYLLKLDYHLKKTVDGFNPDFVFFQSGVDVLDTDKLGRLSLSLKGCIDRDRLVFNTCIQNKIPVAVSMGGGYSKEIRMIIEAHANTFRLASELYF